MIGYDRPIFDAKLPMVKQDFDTVHETDRTTVCGQVKCPSLSDYDHSDYDNEDADLTLGLDRWGDLRVPDRLTTR